MDACTLVYEDYAPTINSIAARFAAKWRLDADECQSEAQLAFVKAFRTYDAAKGDLKTRVYYCVWSALQDWLTATIKHKRRHTSEELAYLSTQPRFDLNTWLAELSDDAQTVVGLTLGEKRPNDSSVTRLLRDLGWGWQQISTTFKEIQEALS